MWALFGNWKEIDQFWGFSFEKQDSVLVQTLHGPAESEGDTPVLVFC